MRSRISAEELLAEIDRLEQGQPCSVGFFTVDEYAQKWGRSRSAADQILTRLFEEGLLDTSRVVKVGKSGRPMPIPCYRIKKRGGKK